MRRRIALLTVLLVATAAAAPAQRSAPMAGDRVRITTRSNVRVVGRLLSDRADSVVVATDSAAPPRTLARAEIAGVEVSEGTYTHRARDGTIGALAGGITGALIGSSTTHAVTSQCTSTTNSAGCAAFAGVDQALGAVVGALVGIAAGGGVGLLLGARPSERWVRAQDRPSVRIGLAPASTGAVRMMASLRF